MVFSGRSAAAAAAVIVMSAATVVIVVFSYAASVIAASVSQRERIAVIISPAALPDILSAFFDIVTRYSKSFCIQSE